MFYEVVPVSCYLYVDLSSSHLGHLILTIGNVTTSKLYTSVRSQGNHVLSFQARHVVSGGQEGGEPSADAAAVH